MKNKIQKIIISILFSFSLISCEKKEVNTEHIVEERELKAKYIYSSSAAEKPYTTVLYYYNNGKLVKELTTDCPISTCSSNIYQYSDDGKLSKKTYMAKEGLNQEGQTEADFSVIWETTYQYINNKTIEETYRDGQIINTVIYEYDFGNRLVKEIHQSQKNYIIYKYDGAKIVRSLSYDVNDSLLMENIYTYRKAGDTEFVEIFYKGGLREYLSEKKTYKNGQITDYIKYHPTFLGQEWFYQRYEYQE